MRMRKVAAGLAIIFLVSLAARAQNARAPIEKPNYGITNVTYYTIAAVEFLPIDSSLAYSNGTKFDRYPLGVSVGEFQASPHLPSGALLTSVEFDYCDNNPNADANDSLYVSDVSWDGTYLSQVAALNSSGFPGCSFDSRDVSAQGYTVDNVFHRLVLQIVASTGPDPSFVGVILGYRLQVSPAPATQTFSDVPTNHQFFQFVEALAAAGITAGYPDGRFGVDDPITRAPGGSVFLSKRSWADLARNTRLSHRSLSRLSRRPRR